MAATAAKLIGPAARFSGVERTAILLMYLDKETARAVLEQLPTDDLEEIGVAMAGIEEVDIEVVKQVVGKFVLDLHGAAQVPRTGPDFALKVYPMMLPSDDRGRRVSSSLRRNLSTEFADLISRHPPAAVASVLAQEHPQSQAVALLLMGAENASQIVGLLPDNRKQDLVMRLAQLRAIPAELADEVERGMRAALSSRNQDLWEVKGLDRAAKIIGLLERDAMDELLDEIEDVNADLSERLRRRLVVFEDLVRLSDKAIQTLLRRIERDTLTMALRGADANIADLFFRNMSSRAAEDLREEIDILGPVPRSAVEEARENIAEVVVQMVDSGALRLPGAGSDDMV